MNLTEKQKTICRQVLNVFETGSPTGKYGSISIYNDGPGKIRQVTFGRSQTTEYGNLKELLQSYVSANGKYAGQLQKFLPLIGQQPLVDNQEFLQLLKSAGNEDPLMIRVQDEFFDKVYFNPALAWCDVHGMVLPLSALVIYDSFIHSGSIPMSIRNSFPASTPDKSGDEKTWITQYVDARYNWLANNSNPALHPTVYRMDCFKKEISRNNWDLSILPIDANGTKVSG